MEEKHVVVPFIDESYKMEPLGKGAYGVCYRTEYGDVFKEFLLQIPTYSDFIRLVGIYNPYFVFPEKTIYLEEYDEDNLMGYIMEFIDGSKFSELPVRVNMIELFKQFDLFEKSLKDLTEETGIVLHDLHEENAIITLDGDFKFLDTDLYGFSLDEPYYTYMSNIKEFGNFLLGFFLSKYEIKDSKLKEYYDRCVYSGKVKPSIILNEALLEMEKELKETITTFGDFYRAKKLIKEQSINKQRQILMKKM